MKLIAAPFQASPVAQRIRSDIQLHEKQYEDRRENGLIRNCGWDNQVEDGFDNNKDESTMAAREVSTLSYVLRPSLPA
jgi:hypothetical protein